MALADSFNDITGSMPPDWRHIELHLALADEDSRVRAQDELVRFGLGGHLGTRGIDLVITPETMPTFQGVLRRLAEQCPQGAWAPRAVVFGADDEETAAKAARGWREGLRGALGQEPRTTEPRLRRDGAWTVAVA